jgi:transglutaminase-like putative cysteine protease
MAARFVSGYLYAPALDAVAVDGTPAIQGAGSTHAWVQVYLPGAGWVPFDPTNNLLSGTSRLIRVGVARDPRQASPISGSWFGPADSYLGLSASVQVSRVVG